MTNQVISEAEETQPLHHIQNGRDSKSAANLSESSVKDESRGELASEEDEREIPLEVPELDREETLKWMGRFIGRIHAIGALRPFTQRPTLMKSCSM